MNSAKPMTPRGKTLSITSRLPDFYDGDRTDSLLHQFIDVFGALVEQAEADVLHMIRTHHVQTADNEGSQGFLAPQKGDLDKILALYLEALGGTSQLLQVSHRFSVGSFKDVGRLARKLQQRADPLSEYMRTSFTAANSDLLDRYDLANVRFQEQSFLNVIQFVSKLADAPDPVSQYLGAQVLPDESEPELAPGELMVALNQQLRNPSLYRKHKAYFQALLLPDAVQELIDQAPIGDDLERLNRMLLEAAYPEEIRWAQIPRLAEVEQGLIWELNRCLQDPDLYERHQAMFAQFRLAPPLQTLLDQWPLERQALEPCNRLLLEAAYPYAIDRSDAPYRQRLLGLIQVLRRGAATKQGILDLIAANLGILGDTPQAQQARQLIQIEEYLPEQIRQSQTIHPRPAEAEIEAETVALPLPLAATVTNPNPLATTPSLRVQLTDLQQGSSVGYFDRTRLDVSCFDQAPTSPDTLPDLQPLVNPRLVNVTTGEAIEYDGTLQVGDVLQFLADGRVLVNGVEVAGQLKTVPQLPPGQSRWSVEAEVGEAAGWCDRTYFDSAYFDQAPGEVTPLDAVQAANYALEVTVEFEQRTPGSFRVRIPWDIPGYTDKFDEAGDHPRTQIQGIIEKVKAAGVLSIINYEKIWREHHDLDTHLWVERSPFTDEHIAEEANFDVKTNEFPLEDSDRHEISDQFITGGMFDYTGFDSGNRFG